MQLLYSYYPPPEADMNNRFILLAGMGVIICLLVAIVGLLIFRPGNGLSAANPVDCKTGVAAFTVATAAPVTAFVKAYSSGVHIADSEVPQMLQAMRKAKVEIEAAPAPVCIAGDRAKLLASMNDIIDLFAIYGAQGPNLYSNRIIADGTQLSASITAIQDIGR